MTGTLPIRLKADAILEAGLEIRFEPDPSLVSEIVVGRLADADEWRTLRAARLPTADIPAAIRRANPALKYQPSLDMTSADGKVSFRVGPQVLAYVRRGTYPGWAGFGPELERVINHLYRVIPNVQVSRLGLRYINALKSDTHGIRSIDDMGIKISFADGTLSSGINLNFKTYSGTDLEVMCRIASVDLAEGNIPEGAAVIVDIDVHTSGSFAEGDVNAAKRWVKEAHDREKEIFFKSIGSEATERLREA